MLLIELNCWSFSGEPCGAPTYLFASVLTVRLRSARSSHLVLASSSLNATVTGFGTRTTCSPSRRLVCAICSHSLGWTLTKAGSNVCMVQEGDASASATATASAAKMVLSLSLFSPCLMVCYVVEGGVGYQRVCARGPRSGESQSSGVESWCSRSGAGAIWRLVKTFPWLDAHKGGCQCVPAA